MTDRDAPQANATQETVAFLALSAGRMIPFYAFERARAFFGTDWGAACGQPVLLYVPMKADGGPTVDEAGNIDVADATNMREAGDGALLAEINALFGTRFQRADFPVR